MLSMIKKEISAIENGVINSGEKTYKYKFDKEGNWIECTTFKDGTPWVLSIRNIEYY